MTSASSNESCLTSGQEGLVFTATISLSIEPCSYSKAAIHRLKGGGEAWH
jgi:hypothetical protein